MDDARRVAQVLDIPYYVMNFKKEFRENVMDYFADEYLLRQNTESVYRLQPLCEMGSRLLQRSLAIGADYIATGHYARIEQLAKWHGMRSANSVTAAKDQTYALYNLTQEQLSHTLMPVGDYTKDQIREIAAKDRSSGSKKAGLPGDLLRAGSGLRFLYPERDRNRGTERQFREYKG